MPVEKAYLPAFIAKHLAILILANRVKYKANFLVLLLHVVNILLQIVQDTAEKQIFFRR